MRLAHFSDVHVTAPPFSAAGRLFGKRLAGTANYYFGGRGRHFFGADHRLARLLEDLEQIGVDHALCTGDLTQMAFPEEFERAASVLAQWMKRPSRLTVLPGNHDRYTEEAVERDDFGRWFGEVSAPGGRPPVVFPAPGVAIALLDVTRPCTLLDSSGWCGPERLAELSERLRSPDLKRLFVVLALHYGLVRSSGEPDRPRHGIRDHAAVAAALLDPSLSVDLVVHGHMHRPFVTEVSGRPVVCSGSATDLAVEAGYHVFDIDPMRGVFTIERRVWCPRQDRYRPGEAPAGAQSFGGRGGAVSPALRR